MKYKVGDRVRVRTYQEGLKEVHRVSTVKDIATLSTGEVIAYMLDDDDLTFMTPENILGLDTIDMMKRGKNV